MQELAKFYQALEICADRADYERLVGLLSLEAPFGWEEAECEDRIVFTVLSEDSGYLQNLASKVSEAAPAAVLSVGTVEQKNWLEAWKDFFHPVECGRLFVVLPPWLQDQASGERKKIIINPKSAFGTGHHASTALCLNALSQLVEEGRVKPGQSFLDLGCGSGILGIAACLCGMHGLALDIDGLAVANARENAALNGVEGLEIAQGDVTGTGGRKFALVLANILSGPLIDMAARLAECVSVGGQMVLSGILDNQADAVAEAYGACGLMERERLSDGHWRALTLERKKPGAGQE